MPRRGQSFAGCTKRQCGASAGSQMDRQTVPAAGLTKHSSHSTPVPALLYCLGCLLPAGAKPGLPPSLTWMKEAMGLQCMSGPSLPKDSSLLKPHSETLVLCPPREEGEAQPGAVYPSRDHLGAPQHSRGLLQTGLQHRSKAGWVLQQLFPIRNYQLFLSNSSCLALCPASSGSHCSQRHIRSHHLLTVAWRRVLRGHVPGENSAAQQ